MRGAITVFFEYHASVRSEMTVIAQLDSVHHALEARDTDLYNPFRVSSRTNADSNPFARHRFDTDSNPFGILREKR